MFTQLWWWQYLGFNSKFVLNLGFLFACLSKCSCSLLCLISNTVYLPFSSISVLNTCTVCESLYFFCDYHHVVDIHDFYFVFTEAVCSRWIDVHSSGQIKVVSQQTWFCIKEMLSLLPPATFPKLFWDVHVSYLFLAKSKQKSNRKLSGGHAWRTDYYYFLICLFIRSLVNMLLQIYMELYQHC